MQPFFKMHLVSKSGRVGVWRTQWEPMDLTSELKEPKVGLGHNSGADAAEVRDEHWIVQTGLQRVGKRVAPPLLFGFLLLHPRTTLTLPASITQGWSLLKKNRIGQGLRTEQHLLAWQLVSGHHKLRIRSPKSYTRGYGDIHHTVLLTAEAGCTS
ncbi:hypothetical protein AV530_000136 [Patagioenas fasciata monilis]|uniref:Uncharacterized protein n=1 Tax=Patagioenas fasciata monilis TaxID=372326 RepID=A0A1V4K062_PATFA|nr:hypothetical protein AV530_000136 [Patagioenas fasciata monilis]